MSRLCSHAWQIWALNSSPSCFRKFSLSHAQFKFCVFDFHSLKYSVRTLHQLANLTCIKNVSLTRTDNKRQLQFQTHSQLCRNHRPSSSLTFSRTYARGKRTGSKTPRANTHENDHDDDVPNDVEKNQRGVDDNVSALFIPIDVPIKTSVGADEINIGEELGGSLRTQKARDQLLTILEDFKKRPTLRVLAEEKGLDSNLYDQAFRSFQNYIINSHSLEPELHIILGDILVGAGHVDDIFPYFIRHAHRVFPALDCMDDLKKISDLTDPAQWYTEARTSKRKIIFHAGPTNSGKTYHALERFFKAKSGVYCGPLKLLANEVHGKTNDKGIFCDMVTGEERRFARDDGLPSNHIACTVEMTNIAEPYEVAVIDEIQMLRDKSRGWAWTRAFLGLCAKEIHLCGEAAAIDIVKQLVLSTGDEMEVREYKRLTPLQILDKPLGSLENVRPGDCIVAFSKKDLYQISRDLEAMGKECAVIYGSLPPGTKLGQAKRFNDPEDPCKVLVATDAIGMGLNLSIKRIIFYSITKPSVNDKGEREMDVLSTSQALQIAGRAGRFGTDFAEGEATTYHGADLSILKQILAKNVEAIEMAGLHPTAEQIELFAYHLPQSSLSNLITLEQILAKNVEAIEMAGLHPTAEQIELFAYHLSQSSLSNLIDIFIKLSQLETNYFVCNMDDFKALAEMLEHIPLHLRARYVYCCAPLDRRQTFVCTMFLKFARQYSRNEAMNFDWFCRQINWPPYVPKTIEHLVHLEAVHDVMDLYLWLSYRFMDMFPDAELVRDIQKQLDTTVIQAGVANITKLIQVTQEIKTGVSAGYQKGGKESSSTEKELDRVFKPSEKLVQMGILSKQQMAELRSEFTNSPKKHRMAKKYKK